MPTSNVLNPILENLFNSSSRFNFESSATRCFTMLSAPFIYSFITPLLFITTDILLRSDVNGNTSRRSNVLSEPLILIVVVD